MKIARIVSAHYPEYIRDLYLSNPELRATPFAEQKNIVKGTGFQQYYGYEECFNRLGVDAVDIVFDLESLQFQWAKENGLNIDFRMEYDEVRESLLKILVAQLNAYKPDVLLVHNVRLFEGGMWQYIREQVPSVRWVTATLTAVARTPMQLLGIDSLLCCLPAFQEEKFTGGLPNELMYYCLDVTEFEGEKTHLFTFFGSTGTDSSKHHRDRYKYLLYLMATTPMQVFGRETGKKPSDEISLRKLEERHTALRENVQGKNFSQLAELIDDVACRDVRFVPELSTLFPNRVAKDKAGFDYLRGMSNSLVTFNIHSHLTRGTVGNMRTFEAPGSGSCMLIEKAPNLADVFEPDSEVVVYSSKEEASEKALWLLEHPAKAIEIGMAGYRRVNKDHTFENRAKQIINHVTSMLGKLG